MADEKNFPIGIWFKDKRFGAPDFVKGSISIKVKDAINWLQLVENKGGYVNLDLLVSKGGKPYCELNTWEPGEKDAPKGSETTVKKTAEEIEYPDDDINPEDIPF